MFFLKLVGAHTAAAILLTIMTICPFPRWSLQALVSHFHSSTFGPTEGTLRLVVQKHEIPTLWDIVMWHRDCLPSTLKHIFEPFTTSKPLPIDCKSANYAYDIEDRTAESPRGLASSSCLILRSPFDLTDAPCICFCSLMLVENSIRYSQPSRPPSIRHTAYTWAPPALSSCGTGAISVGSLLLKHVEWVSRQKRLKAGIWLLRSSL